MHLRGGRYETIGKIAVGGMAKVLLGRAVGPGGFERLVAIKAMHEHLAEEPEFVAMFLDEARLAARIHHPNVVSTLDVGEDELGIFLVMEYVEGPALDVVQRAVAKAGHPLPLDVALRIFLDAMAGLHAAHELRGPGGALLNLVHRDVSPQNMIVGVDGITRLTDFGVARAESRLTRTGTGQVKGKLAFMAPEQLQGLPLDRRTDVYAAGAVLWEMLTGQRLVDGENDGAKIAQVLATERRSPRARNPAVPEAIEAACLCALARAADDRFATAADFSAALEAAGAPIASARAVGDFIVALDAHRRPSALPAAPAAPAPLDPRVEPTGTRLTASVASPRPPSRRAAVVAGASVVAFAALAVGSMVLGGSGAPHPAATSEPAPAACAAPPALPPSAPVPVLASAAAPAPSASAHGTRGSRPAIPPPAGHPARPSPTSFRPVDL